MAAARRRLVLWVADAVAGPGAGGIGLGRLALAEGRALRGSSSARPGALRGAEQTVPVAMATATAGIMIGIILQTGLAMRFTSFLVDFAGGHLFIALVITMLAADRPRGPRCRPRRPTSCWPRCSSRP